MRQNILLTVLSTVNIRFDKSQEKLTYSRTLRKRKVFQKENTWRVSLKFVAFVWIEYKSLSETNERMPNWMRMAHGSVQVLYLLPTRQGKRTMAQSNHDTHQVFSWYSVFLGKPNATSLK